MVSIISLLIYQFGPNEKQKDSEGWQLTIKTTKTCAIAAIGPDVVSLLEHINIFSGTWYVAIGLVDVFFSISSRKKTRISSHSCRKNKSIIL